MGSLYDTLKPEFCPPLDTSLLAALVADLDTSASSPPPGQVNALRATLEELAHLAAAQYDHELDSAHLSSSLSITTDDSNSGPDFCAETTESSTTSDSSSISYQCVSSPLAFLRAALPHIPQSRLRRALSEAGTGDDDIDMEVVVGSILTSEFIRELEERGLNALTDVEPRSPFIPWDRVEPIKKPTSDGKPAKKKRIRPKTITLIDICQKQHLSPSTPAPPPALDPWTQLASLSEQLASLLPPYPTSFFQSHFHSPSYVSPARALRAALSSIAATQNKSSSRPSTTDTLFTMLDVLRDSPTYASLDPEQRSILYADTQLALRATRGRGDDALDIVWLLLDLDLDLESGTLAMGIYHSPQSPLFPSRPASIIFSSTSPPGRDRGVGPCGVTHELPTGPPPVQPTSKSIPSPLGIFPTTTNSHPPYEWQTVPQKQRKGSHPLALHIPTYDTASQSRRSAELGKTRGMGNELGMGDVGKLARSDLKERMAASLRKRDELLREASKAWNRGNARTRGGEVALYFAERARGFQELARREALDAARTMVESKRSRAADRRTVDLHGTSISEAVVIVKEILEKERCSTANPLRIITGRGTHSANGIGVLKPAVRNALAHDGWNVGVWDGGLVVRGRT